MEVPKVKTKKFDFEPVQMDLRMSFVVQKKDLMTFLLRSTLRLLKE
ncbi:MAG: hypothetical protein ACTSWR_08205 [Candidatus Helarchaeota archaeon]